MNTKLKGIPKLVDANYAGTPDASQDCTLILTEGDSSKSMVIVGLSDIGWDHYGVFPLTGIPLNVRSASRQKIEKNEVINNIIKIIGLRKGDKYDTVESLKKLRYGHIMIMTDQDPEGSHIKGLLINFFHLYWPDLLQHDFIQLFVTPLIKATKNTHEKSFYSLPEFKEWKRLNNWRTWTVKYYKGLGSSTSKEAKKYFSDMAQHRISFLKAEKEDYDIIDLAFNKEKTKERKTWLTNWMKERKDTELYLYKENVTHISYKQFIYFELSLYMNRKNERSIPSLVDGFKPVQRKVLFACFKRNLVNELKVTQLAGSVAELSAYHHGETPLMETIVKMAQNFVGRNNVNLLEPRGQFGTRLCGGKDAANPRYISTLLSTLARRLFSVHDDPFLKYIDDIQRVEPEWYIPIIPMVLVNGAMGIGMGWSTDIPNYKPRDIVDNIKLKFDGNDLKPMPPWFKNFKGKIEILDDKHYVVFGEVTTLDEEKIEITELPIGEWTHEYKEKVLDPMLRRTITDYKEHHTDTTVKFVITMTKKALKKAKADGLNKVFKLRKEFSTNNMVLFNAKGNIKRYSNVKEIFDEFYELRLEYYQRRKDYMMGVLKAEILTLQNQARFIQEKVAGTIVINMNDMIKILADLNYDSDPIKAWKESQENLTRNNQEDPQASDESETQSEKDYDYLLNMPVMWLTTEKKDELLKQRDAKANEKEMLHNRTSKDLWRDDLDGFIKQLDIVEEQQRDEE